MTEREILERQESTGNREYFLVLVGSFLHAYGHGAFALSRATIVTFSSGSLDPASNDYRSVGFSEDTRDWYLFHCRASQQGRVRHYKKHNKMEKMKQHSF